MKPSHVERYPTPSKQEQDEHNFAVKMHGRLYQYQTGPRAAQQRQDARKHGYLVHADAWEETLRIRLRMSVGAHPFQDASGGDRS